MVVVVEVVVLVVEVEVVVVDVVVVVVVPQRFLVRKVSSFTVVSPALSVTSVFTL